jgi:hypothetical protein
MKKFLAIAAIAGSLVACNNGGEGTKTEDTTVLTTPTTVDTTTVTNATVDSTATTPLVDTAKVVTDTTKTK